MGSSRCKNDATWFRSVVVSAGICGGDRREVGENCVGHRRTPRRNVRLIWRNSRLQRYCTRKKKEGETRRARKVHYYTAALPPYRR